MADEPQLPTPDEEVLNKLFGRNWKFGMVDGKLVVNTQREKPKSKC